MLALLLALFLSGALLASPACGPEVACAPDLASAIATAPTATVRSDGQPDLDPGAFAARGLRRDVLELALRAFANAWRRGETRSRILTVIDYSLPSSQRRLWVLDLASNRLLFHEYVAHGSGSGEDLATRFSNRDGTHRSNLGLLVTAETYDGKHGYSLKLDGLESGWNDNARERAIVFHAADYVSEATIRRQGRLGRSWGCPALEPAVARAVIDTIKGGSLVFGYAPDPDWLRGSRYLR
jgi:hypothetical protein